MIAARMRAGASLAICIAVAAMAPRAQGRATLTTVRTGTIAGHVAFAGRPPGNPIIRMGMDPKCAELNRGRQVIQEQAMVSADGSVANVFVRLEGDFPNVPVPSEPITIDQRSCVYGPRVVGVRVGQRLRIRNGDDLLHNVHSSSGVNNSFNVAQPAAGAVFEFTPKSPEIMLKLGCDVHRWMIAFVGVVPHPYFAVTDSAGHYTIARVPPGTYTIRTWHEQFGERTQTVTVRAGATTTIDFGYGAAAGK